MTNKKSTKRALLMSALALVMCLSLLIGSTYAWFTDSVTSSGNKIVSGKLEVDLLMGTAVDTYHSIADQNAAIFGANSLVAQNNAADTLWEPGKTQIVYLGVENKGNLALKYNIALNVVDGGLVGALEYAIIDGAKFGDITATDWAAIKGDANAQTGDVAAGITVAAPNGAIEAATAGQEAVDYFALAVHMKEDAGNQYQDKDITIDVTVLATQLTSEEDAFNNQYDKDAEFPVNITVYKPVNVDANNQSTGDVTITFEDDTSNVSEVEVVVPQGAKLEAGTTKLVLNIKEADSVDSNVQIESNQSAKTYNISIEGLADTNTEDISVKLFIEKGLADVKLYHNATLIDSDYNATTGELSFVTTGFSPFTIVSAATVKGKTNVGPYSLNVLSGGEATYDAATKTYSIPVATVAQGGYNASQGGNYFAGYTVNVAGYDANATVNFDKADGSGVTTWKLADEEKDGFINNGIHQQWTRVGRKTAYRYDVDGDGVTDFTVVNDVSAAKIEVANAEQLQKMLDQGKPAILTADINVDVADTGFTVAKGVEAKLDLNGHDIIATSTSANSVQLFSVNGTLDIVGNGTISLTNDDFAWNTSYRYTAINIREVGVVTLGEGVNVVCKAGTEKNYGMSYAVDIYTTGTLTVNGASLNSNYIAVRCFYGNSVVNVNSGSITSTNPKGNWGIWPQSAPGAQINIASGIDYTTDDYGIYIFG